MRIVDSGHGFQTFSVPFRTEPDRLRGIASKEGSRGPEVTKGRVRCDQDTFKSCVGNFFNSAQHCSNIIIQ